MGQFSDPLPCRTRISFHISHPNPAEAFPVSANIHVAALSDIGCVRTNNEDNFGYDPANDLYVVCDGMGGMAAGEVASSIACGTVISVFSAQPEDIAVERRLALAIRAANDAVRATAAHTGQRGMGTTLVAAVIRGNRLLIGNVGDSRAYRLQRGTCSQLTIDHSYINELIRQGTVKAEDVDTLDLKGMQSVITRAIGAAPDVEPDFFFVDLQDGDTILLASDGLTRYVEGDTIGPLISAADLEGSSRRLIQAANNAGGADNVTCLLLRYDVPRPAQPPPSIFRPASLPTHITQTLIPDLPTA